MLYFSVVELLVDMLSKYLILSILFFICFFLNSSFAIEEIDNDVQNNVQTLVPEADNVKAKLSAKISYDDILNKAKEHSFDLQLADFDTFIAKTGIKSARSEYFPKLAASANAEYNKSFADMPFSVYVGDSFVNPYTRYQSLFGLTLSYNVFDFGVRKGHLDMAKEDTYMKELIQKGQLQELNLNITDLYFKILLAKKQIDLNEQILKLGEKNLEMKSRLFKIKELSKNELNTQIVENKKASRNLFELKAMLAENLHYLEFYTGEEYDIENLSVEDVQKPEFDPFSYNDYTQSVTYDIQNAAIAKKEQELKIVKRTNFPKVNLYSKYYLYDSHTTNYLKTLGIEPSNWSIGASVNMPVFDGLKNSADIDKAKLELARLYVERDRALADLKNKVMTLRSNYSYMEKQVADSEQILKELRDNELSMNRMLKKGLVSPIELTQAKLDLLEEEIEYEKNSWTLISILKAIQILTTYDKG